MRSPPDKSKASSSLHNSQQRAGTTKFHRRLSALRGAGQRPSNTQGYPPRRMRSPRGFKITCGQGFPPWILLADCSRRSQRTSSEVSRVPEVLLQATFAGFCTQDHSHSVALRCLGTGYGGAIQDGTRWFDSFTCCSRKVHQVDRSKTNQELKWSDCCDLHHRYHNSVWHTTQHHHRQRHKFCQRRLGPFLCNTGHPTGPSCQDPDSMPHRSSM